MNCPVCKEEALVMAERQGIEIDYCPRCRGVWLDRGELDKIIERVTPSNPTSESRKPEQQHREIREQREYRDYDDDDDDDRRRRGRRRGFLGDLFDFG
ncbi:zf-TFIIB domain-containing protein [Candidatus Acetothermia bacterium]|nr:zf-TFIIB domain-containing protein [Candidatus Acetothermia bacterium]MCI2432156.1 zf-TFIIB domain-containing protein [Candidatus Acetothermia bacterium]MCI2436151.1 zf-TFIIB domain-containing protein [Candidatus Acetothermia bacterium]